ncbi:MAG TPA: DUF885 domain-containing protein [Verrucomicrobiae bacterium]|nr:DUF885 domain-containing protein [Verrucomicrobiae bacterium]
MKNSKTNGQKHKTQTACRKKDRSKWIAALFAFGILMAFLQPAFCQNSENEKLASFFTNYLDEHFRQQPLAASQLGDHRFDGQLDDISQKARDGWLALAQRTLSDLPKAVDYKKLSRDGQIDFEIFQHELETEIWLAENMRPFERDPRTYGGYINDSVYVLLTQSTLPMETNISNCLARMTQIPRIIAAAETTLKHPPKPILETAIRQNRGSISFYENGIFQLAGDTPQRGKLKTAAAKVADELKDYQKFLEGDLMSRADGEWRIGKKKFDKKFELETDAGITAEQNLADAQTEFARVRGVMYVVARQLWPRYFPGQPLPPDDAAGERETIMKVVDAVDQEHGKPEDLVADARATVERIKKFIRERNYLQLPEPDHCKVIEMPEFRRGNSLAYLENAPPLDPKAHSYYAVSPPPSDWTPEQVKSFLEEYNSHMLQILTLHEAYPGHYVQLEYANRNPSLIRRVCQSGPFIEGWAVYGEITMLNEGYGGGDLRLRLMQLKFYLRAVANSILDYKMHCEKMSDAEAMKFMMDDSFQSEGEAKLKLIRAKQSSVQLSTYFVGRMAHYRLHQEIEREMGDKFNLAAYHNAVISHGSIPVKYLPELVRAQLGLTEPKQP